MSILVDKFKEILSEKFSEEEVQSLMADLEIAFRDGSVAISGDTTDSIILTGDRNITGDNNQIVINHGIDLKELINILCQLIPNSSHACSMLGIASVESFENHVPLSDKESLVRIYSEPKFESVLGEIDIEGESEKKYRKEIEDTFYEDYSEYREISVCSIETIKELDNHKIHPIGEQEILKIAHKVTLACQIYEDKIRKYEHFLAQQFSANEYIIDDRARRQLCNRGLALGLEEETIVLLYNQLGKNLYDQNQLEESISVLLEALGIIESADIYFSLGLSFYKLGQKELAINNLDQAQALFEEQQKYEEVEGIVEFLGKII
jgi:tetratricopeptide (TPR) repeat protein